MESVTVTWRSPHNEWRDCRANFCPAWTCVLVPASTLTRRVTWVKLLKVSRLSSQLLQLQRSVPLTQEPALYDNFFFILANSTSNRDSYYVLGVS